MIGIEIDSFDMAEIEHAVIKGTRDFVRSLAREGRDLAAQGFEEAEYPGTNDVYVHLEETPDESDVVATGDAVAFIEFGAGITQANHPETYPEVAPHGQFGKGKGANPNGWIYSGEAGTGQVDPVLNKNGEVRPGVYRTKGSPAQPIMYDTANYMLNRIERQI